MSRQSPTGFVFSMVVEIAAVVVIVSFLPRVDLRPAATAADDNYSQRRKVEPALSPLAWRAIDKDSTQHPTRETSFYARSAADLATKSQPASSVPRREPPP